MLLFIINVCYFSLEESYVQCQAGWVWGIYFDRNIWQIIDLVYTRVRLRSSARIIQTLQIAIRRMKGSENFPQLTSNTYSNLWFEVLFWIVTCISNSKVQTSTCEYGYFVHWVWNWKVKIVLFSVSSGLVIYFSVDSDPVLSEQKRKKRAVGNASSKQQWEKQVLFCSS